MGPLPALPPAGYHAPAAATAPAAADPVPAAGSIRQDRRSYTMEEIRKHATEESAWLAVDGKVYDVTKFIKAHPGGRLPIMEVAGLDATDPVTNYHSPEVLRRWLPLYYIGDVADWRVTPLEADYRKVQKQLEESKMFETDYSFYFRMAIWLVSLFSCSIYLSVGAEGWPWHMLGAALMGLFSQQMAFLSHDLGHNAVTHVAHIDRMLGIFCGNFAIGISLAWWKASHDVHHVSTNSLSHDPDIQHMPLFAYNKGLFASLYSTFHERVMPYDKMCRFMVRYQHYVFYPIMLFARYNLYAQSLIFLLTSPDHRVKNRRLELLTLAMYATWMGVLLAHVPGGWGKTVAYLTVMHAVTGFQHVLICVGHFPRETYVDRPLATAGETFFKAQLATTMDVDCWECLDFLHGGLQFQVIHHLFPRLPRHRLRGMVKVVRALAKKHGVDYHMTSFINANVELLAVLKRTACEADKSEVSWPAFTDAHLFG